MTLDVKALRAAAEAAERADAEIDACTANGGGATYSMGRTAAAAARALHDLCTPTAVLALLDRLERAEAIVGAVEAAYYPAVGDNVERHWYRVRSLLDEARWRDGHTRAALDDEAPR